MSVVVISAGPVHVTHAEAFRRTFPTVGDRLW